MPNSDPKVVPSYPCVMVRWAGCSSALFDWRCPPRGRRAVPSQRVSSVLGVCDKTATQPEPNVAPSVAPMCPTLQPCLPNLDFSGGREIGRPRSLLPNTTWLKPSRATPPDRDGLPCSICQSDEATPTRTTNFRRHAPRYPYRLSIPSTQCPSVPAIEANGAIQE